MILYPTMELLNGHCVSLRQGRLDEAEIWHVDPVETARSWAGAGAEWMHVTNFDWVAGRDGGEDLMLEIIRSVGIPVQVAGGFRTTEAVAHWIDLGAGRVVISTLATQDPDTVKALAKHHPDQIVLSLDIWQGRVMTNGWTQECAYAPEALVEAYSDAPLAAIVVTDIEADISDTEAQMGVISGLAAKSRTPVIARGVVRSVDDVARLKYIPNIAGAMIARPLFSKDVGLSEALNVARPEAEPVAELQ